MYRKVLFSLFLLIIWWLWVSFSWQSGEFLDVDFWNWNKLTDRDINLALFRNNAYSEIWTWYTSTNCSAENIIMTDKLPIYLDENTVYVLNTGLIFITQTINIGNCTAIVSKSWTIIKNDNFEWDIFAFTWQFSILDNLIISGNKKWSWIHISNTNSITINNVTMENLIEWIFTDKSNNIKYNNVKIWNIEDYAFLLKDSQYNKITNFFTYDNIREWLMIEWGWFNILSGINCQNNTGAGVYIESSKHNKLYSVKAYNNKQGIRLYSDSDYNEIYNSVLLWNSQWWLVISSNLNTIKNIYLINNREWAAIYWELNNLSSFLSFNNKAHWMLIMTWINNTIDSWYIYNNASHWILLYNAPNNKIKNVHIFNNWKHLWNSKRCWIMFYGQSDKNDFRNAYIYNNIIWICTNGPVKNSFNDSQIFNNSTTESNTNGATWNILTWISFKTWIIYKTNDLNKENIIIKTWNSALLTGNNAESVVVQKEKDLSFDDMINPFIWDTYLYSRDSEYSDIIWYKPSFFNLNGEFPSYSIWIKLQNEISGNIITNVENIVANWNIESFEIWEKKYEWNKIKYPINTWDVRNTVATNINWKDIHAILVLDTEDPTCEVEYSTTGATTESVIAYLTWCSEEIAWTDLSYPFTKNWEYTFKFTDLVWNSWTAKAIVSRIKPKPVWGGGWWGGGWGWGWTNNEKISTDTSSDTWNRNTKFNFNTWVFDSNYSDEMNMAYQYAYHFKITTQKSITEAWMDQALTRIAMAKMLSMYVMNVLWKKPANTIVPNFEDVSEDLNEQYDYWISLAYQLWIMWINMPENKFRPHDLVTRAEFATALSRLLYWTADWNEFYYSTHLNKLFEKWIIANTNPSLQELRWYVMIMLMRSALWISSTEDFVYPEPETETQEIVRYFTEPYKKGQIYSRIWDLQDLLRYLGYYKLWTNYVYSKATINAVYDFQVAMWLIDADDVNNPARWYLWPETRSALNEKWVEFQHYKNWIANE